MTNRLAQETSPYLLQHADNPVDWYPWGSEAFDRARRLDRPILLSIGYSACHWCHVMERESFEDPDTAALMNGLFVSVKVDREERPDVDSVYMRAVQAMTGQGGWPLTAVLTPEGVPFFGGTYYPPDPRHGMPSFRQVLESTARAYQDRRQDVHAAAAQIQTILERASTPPDVSAAGLPGRDELDNGFRFIASRFDAEHGGFGTAPKFPQPAVLNFLLTHGALTGNEHALVMTVHTLRRMARGGIRDQLDGGFHRYAVDAEWLVPHFEKMLYDNALLARVYLHAWQQTGDQDLRDVVERCLGYICSDLQDRGGGFYSARDADSEGEEGRYYVWTPTQVGAVLGPEDARLACEVHDVTEAGNFEGRNILHQPHDPSAVAERWGVSVSDLQRRLGSIRAQLLRARSQRPEPLRDEKVLAGWTAMTIRALAEAGAALDRADWMESAIRGARFLLDEMRRDDRLLHSWKDGHARISGFLEDYAALGNALLTLHEATLDPDWLGPTRWTCECILELFVDEAGVPYDTAVDAEPLLVRPREIMDNATPAGTSLAAELFQRASVVFDDPRYREAVEGILLRGADDMTRYPMAFGRLLAVLENQVAGAVEIAILGPPGDEGTRALQRTVSEHFLPNRVLVAAATPDQAAATSDSGEDLRLPLLADRTLVDGAPTAYVCRNYACRTPVTTAKELADQLP